MSRAPSGDVIALFFITIYDHNIGRELAAPPPRSNAMSNSTLTATHWGNFRIETDHGRIVAVHGSPADEYPSAIGQSLLDAQDSRVRITQPMIREGFLRHGRGSDGRRRGTDRFVQVSWERALGLAAEALAGIKEDHGNEAIFGGCYGWASAGRFHHAISQAHRFLNMFGGYVSHRDTYSVGAGNVIIPHVLGIAGMQAVFDSVQCEDMMHRTELIVSFGGIAMKNSQVNSGGVGNHSAERQLRALKAAGTRFVNVSPVREDMIAAIGAQWIPLRPTTDTALMLGLAHTLYTEDLYDKPFIERYTVGFEHFIPYLLGRTDGIPKDARWAASIADVPAEVIVDLAREMARKRTLISAAWSLQRAEHGEQPWWMALVLASMLGQVGSPDAGINYGFGSVHHVGFQGRRRFNFKIGDLPQGVNPVRKFIPCARIADMLLNPGGVIDYDGQKITYPDIRAILWGGGNPFHHHQDLNRFRRAWAKPEVVIVNEIYWNALARRADIVFPVTSPVERDDIAGSANDYWLMPSRKAVEPYAQSRHDYDVYTGLAECLGFRDRFTEGRSAAQWIRRLYEVTVDNAAREGIELPDFDTFWSGGPLCLAQQLPPRKYTVERFREDPEGAVLPLTASGKIEVFCQWIADLRLTDCIGHPAWFDKREWLGAKRVRQFPLHLISNQPKTKLHSQLDHGVNSRRSKIKGREVICIHPRQAEERGVRDGDIVRVFNERGACLAAAKLTEDVRIDVVMLPTGSWYDPGLDNLESHGNPNVLTQDIGSSGLSQGCTSHSCLVQIEPYRGELPPITVHSQPEIITEAELQ